MELTQNFSCNFTYNQVENCVELYEVPPNALHHLSVGGRYYTITVPSGNLAVCTWFLETWSKCPAPICTSPLSTLDVSWHLSNCFMKQQGVAAVAFRSLSPPPLLAQQDRPSAENATPSKKTRH